MIPEREPDGSTGLVVSGLIWQLISWPEPFVSGFGADAASQVEAFRDEVIPNAVQRLDVGSFAGERRHIGHSRVEITGADSVPDGFLLLNDRLMVLGVFAVLLAVAASAFIDEKFGKFQVTLVAGDAVKLHETDLDLFVPGRITTFAGPEGGIDQVCILQRDVEECSFAGSLVMSDGGLVHVADVVELVAVREEGPAIGA